MPGQDDLVAAEMKALTGPVVHVSMVDLCNESEGTVDYTYHIPRKPFGSAVVSPYVRLS